MNDDEGFQDLLDQYLLARARGDGAALTSLAAAHPRYEHRLTAYALLDAAVDTEPMRAALAPAAATITPALRQRALAAAFAGSPAPVAAIAGILVRAKSLGLSGGDLAAALELPRDVLLQLDRRLIDAASLPRRLVQRLAEVLQTGAESVQACLGGSPAVRVAAYNFAPAPPQAGEPVSFAEALANSPLATSEQRAVWETALRDEGRV